MCEHFRRLLPCATGRPGGRRLRTMLARFRNQSRLVLALLCFAGCSAVRPGSPVEIPPNGVLREEFGRVPAGRTLEKTFVIANSGPRPIGLQARGGSCSCVVFPDTAVITAGKTLAIDLRVDTRALQGPVQVVVEFATTDVARPILQLILAGDVLPPVEVRPEVLYFGQLTDPANHARRLQIEPSSSEYRIRRVSSASGRLGLRRLASAPEATVGKRGLMLEVTLPQGLQAGGFEDQLLIETTDPKLAVFTVPVLAIVLPH